MPDFVSFGEFKDRLRESRADRHFESLRAMKRPTVAAPGVTVRGAAANAAVPSRTTFDAEFAKMKDFLLKYYPDDMECAHSYMDSNGNFVDCIPFDQQPTARTAAAAGRPAVDRAPKPPRVVDTHSTDPLRRPPLPTRLRPPLHRGMLDQFGNRIVCPEGCVTIPRITPAQMSQCGTFDRFFSKLMPPVAPPKRGAKGAKTRAKASPARTTAGKTRKGAPPVPPQAFVRGHRYATCDVATPGPYFGCRTVMSVWQPLLSTGVFSLSQLWMVGSGAPNGQPCTIESGWMVYPGFQRGDGRVVGTDPVIFVFFNPDGYADPRSGGRNGYVEGATRTGFIRLSSGNGWPIMSSAFRRTSDDGDQVGIEMMWSLQDVPSSPGRLGWYLFMRKPDVADYDAVGYIPADEYAGTSLASQAGAIRFGGETAAATNQQGQIVSGYGPMGSGNPPRSDPFASGRDVAFHTQIAVQTGGPNAPGMVGAALTPGPTDRPHYDGNLPTEPGFESFFFFGGAGAPFTGD